MVNIKKPVKAQTPKQSHLYRKYDEITLDHCKSLLVHLYGGKGSSWVNPITGNTIKNSSYITISFLSKCYYIWGNKIATINSKKLKYKKHIEKFIAKEYLFDIPAIKPHAVSKQKLQGALVNVMNKRNRIRSIRGGTLQLSVAILEGYNTLFAEFSRTSGELKVNCKDGELKNHKYISDIVNSILNIICYVYKLTSSNIPLYIYMYDNVIEYDDFKEKYENNEIKYQKDDLMKYVNDDYIVLNPKTIERYYENTLFNRQYVFELSKKEDVKITITYNQINTRDEDKLAETPFNYNITNSVLPKVISIDVFDMDISDFLDSIIISINKRLALLPIINTIKTELTPRLDYYEGIITQMGKPEINFGDDDIIRKNILYSLIAQFPAYYEIYNNYKGDLYYNYGYTGSFPIFTWIPITTPTPSELGDEPITDIYNFPLSSRWQPFDLDNDTTSIIGKAYKNYNKRPFSKSLNETIYKVISGDESTIVDEGMMKRINETIGIYKDMDKVETYTNKKIYLYHGTKQKLNMMLDSKDDIEILGFLSTTLNIQVASLYSRCHLQNNYETESESCIYIIEVDESKTYINLNDNLYQFLLLPYSIIKIVYEFYYMDIKIILCSLIKTPTKEQNNELYNKLLQKQDIMAGKGGGEMTRQERVVSDFLKRLLPTMVKEEGLPKSSGTTREEANNKINASISQYKSMYKFTDLPKDFQKYYKEEQVELPFDENEEIDIYNGCHFRLIPKELKRSEGGSVRKKKVKSLKNPILSNSVKKVRKRK
jgi:hypothetical protein